jgi:hypothetical protein
MNRFVFHGHAHCLNVTALLPEIPTLHPSVLNCCYSNLISCFLQIVPMGAEVTASWMYQLMEPLHKELPGLQLVALQCHSLDISFQP